MSLLFTYSAISLTFVERVYNTVEQDREIDDLVFVAKENNVVTEQVLRILVQAAPGSAGIGEYHL